ncbi:MAG: hypothetical protein Q8O89_00265 [Nanoarchaeota archaeon]|nr:hypothetical protein [Nanoarchaeota archaeon]
MKTYKADLHVHTKFIEDSFSIGPNKSKIWQLIKNNWKTLLKGLFVKRTLYKKILPKSDVALLDVLHIPESTLEPDDAVNCAMNNGMTFVPITNHNDVEAAIYLAKKFRKKILIGEEISVMIDKKRIMHILIYFMNYSRGELLYSKKDIEEIRMIHAQIQDYRENLQALVLILKKHKNIFISCAHPFSKTAFSRFIFTKSAEIDNDIIKTITQNFDTVEVFNGSYSELDNFLAREFALKYEMGFSAGSDAHEMINDVEKGIISMPGSTYVECEARSLKEFFGKMKKRQIRIVGTRYRIEKVKWLLAKKYLIHWKQITNRVDRLILPFSHIIFLYAMTSHFAGYRSKLKTLARKMGLNYEKYLREEFEGVVDLRKAK